MNSCMTIRNAIASRLKTAALLAAASALLPLCSCETTKEAPDSGFLSNPELMKKDDRVPIQKVWRDPQAKLDKYTKILVQPVRTNLQGERSRREERNLRNKLGLEGEDVADFAKYTEDSFKKAIQKGPCRLELAEKPGPDVMALEMSFVKIVQAKPVANAGKTAWSCTPIGACFVPLKYAAKGMTDNGGQSSLAIEGRIVDSQTGHVLAMFAQRSKQCAAVLNVEDFSSYGNLQQIVDAWAAKFVEVVNKRPFETGEKIEANNQWKFINF